VLLKHRDNFAFIFYLFVYNVAQMEESRSTYRISVGKPIAKLSLGRTRKKWKDNIGKCVVLMEMAQDRVQ
jgi:hypothetical protein